MRKRSRFIITFSNGISLPLGEETKRDAAKDARKAAKEDSGVILSQIGVGPVPYRLWRKKTGLISR